MARGERLISFPTSITSGKEKIKFKPLTTPKKKERVAFTRTIMQTPQYKKHLRKGNSRIDSIEKASREIEVNKQGMWFSVKRLPPRLQKVAKKYWVK